MTFKAVYKLIQIHLKVQKSTINQHFCAEKIILMILLKVVKFKNLILRYSVDC